ncbi:MAG: phosphatase PAP2 family protein [Actinobacteria bacterium]|nr:phosphatase PAP2 family protein [Actinomycetota bacterium]
MFAKMVEDLLYHELGTFDTVVAQFIQSFASNGLTKVAILITQIGSPSFDIIIMLAAGSYFLFRLKHTWEALVLAISFAGGGLLSYALKNIFHRARPDIQHLVNAGGYSFPSGHAMISATFYGMLGYLIWLNLRERNKPSWYVAVVTAIFIVSIGISRIYLGVHFPSDVAAGFAAGGAWLTACIIGLNAIRYYRKH